MCGCVIPESPRPAIEFAKIVAQTSARSELDALSSNQEAALESDPQATYNEPLVLPPAVDYLAPFKEWKKLGNDRYGVCVPVTWANMRRLVTSKLTGREVYPSMNQVMDFYKALNEDFIPDKGVVIQDLLNHLVNKGGPDGVRAIAFAQVDITDTLEDIRKALAIFGSVWVGMRVLPQNRDEFDCGQPWTPPPTPPTTSSPPDGHSVLVGGYLDNNNLKIVTWGETAQLTKAFAVSRMYEAWVVIWPEHLGSRRFTKGVNLNRLRSEFKALTKKDLCQFKPSLNRLHYRLPLHKQQLPTKFLNIFTVVPKAAAGSDETYSSQASLAITPISTKNADRGTLVADNGDLYLIRATDTAYDFVEVTHVFGPAYYELEYEKPIVTAFKSKISQKGFFTIDNGDLYFIKTQDTSSGFVEVYFAPNEQLFQVIHRYVTGFQASVTAARFTISGGDLYLIVKGNEHGALLEIHCARGNAGYVAESITRQTTAVPVEMVSRTLNIGFNGDLYMIRPAVAPSKKFEVCIAEAQRNYQHISRYLTDVEAHAELDATQPAAITTWIV